MDTDKTIERNDDQLVPFSFQGSTLRTTQIDGEPWFIAKDICDVLGLGNPSQAMSGFPKEDRGIISSDTSSGRRYLIMVNEPGLYRLIFQSRKPEAERFKTWVFTEVLPRIRRTGTFGPGGRDEAHRMAGLIYSRFIGCSDLNIQKINRLVYYLAVRPPLTQSDIAKLLGVSPTNVLEWKRRLPADIIEDAAAILALTVSGDALSLCRRVPDRRAARKAAIPNDRPGFPLELPEKGNGHE
jgi:prophage antirepressor-like protein